MAIARRTLLKAALLSGTPLSSGLVSADAGQRRDSIIRSVEVFPANIPYRSTFVIGSGRVASAGQSGQYVYVKIQSAGGQAGWGETIALPTWSYETVESITGTLRKYLAPILIGRSPFEQVYFQKRFDEVLTPAVSQGFPFAKSAAITATLDLAGQIAGLPLHALLGGKTRETVSLSYALSIDEPGAMAEAARAYPGLKCFKVKVAGVPAGDAERVQAVAEARPDADIWIDANQSYRALHLESFIKEVRDVKQIRCLEQPVKSIDAFGMRRARERCPWPIAVDEGCFSSYDVARLARMEAADLVVLKIAKSAGIWGCQRSAFVAEANGMGLLGSGLTEAGIGLAASVHLFSTLDLLLPPELNGPKFLEDLMVDELSISGNVVKVPDRPGLGIRVREDSIRERAIKI